MAVQVHVDLAIGTVPQPPARDSEAFAFGLDLVETCAKGGVRLRGPARGAGNAAEPPPVQETTPSPVRHPHCCEAVRKNHSIAESGGIE
jgi:hypothetical protein